MKKKKFLFLISTLLILFLIITGLVIFKLTGPFDSFIYEVVRSLECDFFDKYFVFVTKFGNEITIVAVVLITMIIFRSWDGWLLGILAANSALTNKIVKSIIQRPRPDVLKLIEQGGYSYPSGHSMISIAVYGYLLYYVVKRVSNKYIKYSLSVLLAILILSVGISRIYVGVHYASDVLGGFIFAAIEVMLIVNYSNKHFRGN